MAQYDLSGSAGGGLSTYSGRNLLDLAPRLQKCSDMLFQVISSAYGRLFFCFITHKYTVSFIAQNGSIIIHKTDTFGYLAPD